MQHIQVIGHQLHLITRIVYGETDGLDVVQEAITTSSVYTPTEARPEYLRQLKLLSIHSHHTGLDRVILTGLRQRPTHTETVPVLVTMLTRSFEDERTVEARICYIDQEHTEQTRCVIFSGRHGPLLPSFTCPADQLVPAIPSENAWTRTGRYHA